MSRSWGNVRSNTQECAERHRRIQCDGGVDPALFFVVSLSHEDGDHIRWWGEEEDEEGRAVTGWQVQPSFEDEPAECKEQEEDCREANREGPECQMEPVWGEFEPCSHYQQDERSSHIPIISGMRMIVVLG